MFAYLSPAKGGGEETADSFNDGWRQWLPSTQSTSIRSGKFPFSYFRMISQSAVFTNWRFKNGTFWTPDIFAVIATQITRRRKHFTTARRMPMMQAMLWIMTSLWAIVFPLHTGSLIFKQQTVKTISRMKPLFRKMWGLYHTGSGIHWQLYSVFWFHQEQR